MLKLLQIVTAILFIALPLTQASAQLAGTSLTQGDSQSTKVALPDPLTPEAVRGLVSTLSDQQVRNLLLERLDAVAKEQIQNSNSNSGVMTLFSTWSGSISNNFVTAVGRIPRIWDGLITATSTFVEKHGSLGVFKFFGIILGAIIVGYTAERTVNQLTRRRRENVKNIDDTQNLFQTLKILGSRLFWDLIALIVFFAVTRAIIEIAVPLEMAPLVEVFMVQLIVIPRWAWVFSRFLNAPDHPELRLINATDDVAKMFHRNMIGITLFAGLSTFLIQFHAMNGVGVGETRLGYWMNAALFTWIIVVSYRARDAIIQILIGARPEEVTPTEMRVARFYPWFTIVLTFLMWCVGQIIAGMGRFDLLGGRQYIVLALIVMSPALDTMIRGLVRHMVAPMQGGGYVALNAYHSTKRSYIRIGRVLMFAMVIMIIASLWDIDFENMASAGVGVQFAGRFLELLMMLATGYLVWEVATLLLNRKLAAEQTAEGFDLGADEPGGGEGGGQGGSRLSTVLPMFRFVIQTTIIVMTILIALSNIGIDTTPLLAGAGIVGIAIGFGAQTLVRDVVSGVFFLIDDAFRVGEYLVIDSTVGTVEKISIRSLQLRHHNGPIHTIPYGEIPKVTNNSRDWVIVKLKWTVPFGTNVIKIKRLFKQIGKEMMETEYAGDLIQTFKSQGVYDVDDVGIVIRGKFMAKPGTQWIIRKDVYQRVQAKLEENDIEFARREVRVQIPGMEAGKELSDAEKQAVAAAASSVVQTAVDKAAGAPKTSAADAQ